MDVTGDWLARPQDDAAAAPAWVARPTTPGAYPVVLVGFEMFGVTPYVQRVAERVAALGYVAAVPDFYHRAGDRIALPATPEGRERGLVLLEQLRREEVLADARAVLGQLGAASGAAMVGLSAGGHLAYYLATQLPLAALAVLYPGWLTDGSIGVGRPQPTIGLTPGIAAAGTPVLLLVGEDDHLFAPAQLAEIEAALSGAGVVHELVVYPGTPHGFFCDERDTWRPAVAADAWARITALLAAALPQAS